MLILYTLLHNTAGLSLLVFLKIIIMKCTTYRIQQDFSLKHSCCLIVMLCSQRALPYIPPYIIDTA